ncbi:MAG: PIN domain-containing protein [Rhodocyclaceae bacterium]|nr:PIN domain-containing protein [Rhodocyclaceae bacterium]
MSAVVVDTSVWIDHFRHGNPALGSLLMHDRVLVHPLIIGEIACGMPPHRQRTLGDLQSLRQCQLANYAEVMQFIERERLFGLGCGIVDMHLLASTLLTKGARLWTLDQRLLALAKRFDAAYMPQDVFSRQRR